jgi:HSP20 family protein
MTGEFRRFIDMFLDGPSDELGCDMWRPRADVYRDSAGWVVKLEAAGVDVGEVRVSGSGRRLIVTGRRRDLAGSEVHEAYSMEIAYCRFQRDIELPCEVGTARFTTEYRDGMLLIRVQTERRGR